MFPAANELPDGEAGHALEESGRLRVVGIRPARWLPEAVLERLIGVVGGLPRRRRRSPRRGRRFVPGSCLLKIFTDGVFLYSGRNLTGAVGIPTGGGRDFDRGLVGILTCLPQPSDQLRLFRFVNPNHEAGVGLPGGDVPVLHQPTTPRDHRASGQPHLASDPVVADRRSAEHDAIRPLRTGHQVLVLQKQQARRTDLLGVWWLQSAAAERNLVIVAAKRVAELHGRRLRVGRESAPAESGRGPSIAGSVPPSRNRVESGIPAWGNSHTVENTKPGQFPAVLEKPTLVNFQHSGASRRARPAS